MDERVVCVLVNTLPAHVCVCGGGGVCWVPVVVDGAGVGVARVARHVVGNHEDDLTCQRRAATHQPK